MAKIFYCGGLLGRLGMLRAVIPVDDLCGVLVTSNSKYVGRAFPFMRRAGPECIVIEVVPGEEHNGWRTGFYLVSQAPVDFESQLASWVPIPPGNWH